MDQSERLISDNQRNALTHTAVHLIQAHPDDDDDANIDIGDQPIFSKGEISNSFTKPPLNQQQKLIVNQLGDFPKKQEIKDNKVYIQLDGTYYCGNWKNDQKNGYGLLFWPSGDFYEGEWINDKCEGYGRIVYQNGDAYEGEWKNDQFEGEGKYYYANGCNYNGSWKNDKKHGMGVETFHNDCMYKGSYQNGKKQGEGNVSQMKWHNGQLYEGTFIDDKIEGYGRIQFPNGSTYKGHWLQNQIHGEGEFVYNDGRKYQGFFKQGKKDGYGQYYENDAHYKGHWKDGKQHGQGEVKFPNGEIKESKINSNSIILQCFGRMATQNKKFIDDLFIIILSMNQDQDIEKFKQQAPRAGYLTDKLIKLYLQRANNYLSRAITNYSKSLETQKQMIYEFQQQSNNGKSIQGDNFKHFFEMLNCLDDEILQLYIIQHFQPDNVLQIAQDEFIIGLISLKYSPIFHQIFLIKLYKYGRTYKQNTHFIKRTLQRRFSHILECL